MPLPPPPTVLVHDNDDNVGVRPNSDAIVPQLQSPAAAVVIAINIIHLLLKYKFPKHKFSMDKYVQECPSSIGSATALLQGK
jgi:hypothetical protein